jgi:hypothetical protein
MLEIIILLALTKNIGNAVESKGYKSAQYKWLTAGLWFGGEIVGGFIGVLLTGGDESAQCLLYIIALVGAAIGAWIANSIANNLPVVGPSLVPTAALGSVIASHEDHLPKMKNLKEMHDTGLITAHEYDAKKAEILSRLVNEPTQMSAPTIPIPIELITDLQQGNDRQRRAASYKLGKFRDSAAVTVLIGAYNDTDSSVRQNVIDGLRRIGTQEALDFLNSHNIQSVQGKNNTKYALQFVLIVVAVIFVIVILSQLFK